MLDGSRTIHDGGRDPALTDSCGGSRAWRRQPTIDIGLVNNMPDPVLHRTERQFEELLQQAAGNQFEVRLHLLAIPDVARGEVAAAEIRDRYNDVNDIAALGLDALIVTGAEPRARHLQDEVYWASLTRLIDWAGNNVGSVIWSCLAAHAAVKHIDGVDRRPIGMKRFGVFRCETEPGHAMVSGFPASLLIPHSRYNDLAEEDLLQAGYSILTRSAAAGVDMFVKQHKSSLFVFLQGHPEYDATSLWREYRRDVVRFLTGERDDYPPLPANYLDPDDIRKCQSFALRATGLRSPELAAAIPDIGEQMRPSPRWRKSAISIYRNWLQQVADIRRTRVPSQMMAELR
ncbi:homoserine O-succinyltransferase MetA [Rhodoblastus sp.]|uniref:homoserine O-succinyltransferase MetA n=1 Tax=Rhodoblastus sp. TaxID=1962975 RepID=UPI003F95AE3D